MPTACIHQPGAKAALESERLVVTWTDDDGANQKRILPLHDLDRIILSETVSITSPALAECLRRNIPVSLLDARGRFLGAFQPATPDHGASRLRHYERTLDPAFVLRISGRIVAAKIYNQRRLIQRIAANRKAEGIPVPDTVPEALDALERCMARCGAADSLDSLRGHEGIAAARYFAAWAALLPQEFPFERRSTRPPLNPVNAVLSFAATLLYHEMHAFLHAHGLDPALGLLHTTENGRWSLALDLIEPFRSVVAEALTLDLFSHKMLNASHFEPHEGGTYLTREGRSKLILQYEKRMERQFMSEAVGHRSTLRQQLENQATLLKSALDTPDHFEPFLMN
jgi:CRISP-associated protein Cas1